MSIAQFNSILSFITCTWSASKPNQSYINLVFLKILHNLSVKVHVDEFFDNGTAPSSDVAVNAVDKECIIYIGDTDRFENAENIQLNPKHL